MVTHRVVKRFQIEGEFLDDSVLIMTRAQLETSLLHSLRSQGYIPLLDVSPAWSTEYDHIHDKWKFLLTIQAVYVGRKKAWEYEGVADNRMLKRSTPKTKSRQS